MKILLVADGRSPITRNWVRALKAINFQVSLLSTFPCVPLPEADSTQVLSMPFSRLSGSQAGNGKGRSAGTFKRAILSPLRKILLVGRHWLGPVAMQGVRRRFLSALVREKPDIVQALRIPFEGMLAAVTPADIPLIVSIWGNDLTLHAAGSPGMAGATRQVLERADGLLADAHRDLRLAKQWGFSPRKPSLVVPGSGGIESVKFSTELPLSVILQGLLADKKILILNPRGMRVYVRNDTIFRAIPEVVKRIPQAHFVCVSMAGQPTAEKWVHRLGIGEHVTLLPFLSQEDLWALMQRAAISLSISTHDGTPNTLLEAMAAGSYPICGDIESIREWITDGRNGSLVNPGDFEGLAKAISEAIRDEGLRRRAAQANRHLVIQKAERDAVQRDLKKFFSQFTG
jgi:glycosyltransferase involved in cell wall biosynthesis